MRRVEVIVVSLAVVLVLLLLVYPKGVKVYQNRERKLVYLPSSTVTEYPGEGKITRHVDERIFVEPKGEGKPFWASPATRASYSEEYNDIYVVPEQDELLYSVGIFEGWEDIGGSFDKYIIVKYPASGETEKHRVNFEPTPNDLYKNEATKLTVENVGIRTNKDTVNALEAPEPMSLTILTYEVVQGLTKKGDSVILVPVHDLPDLAKRDADGNYLASWFIVRRVGGKEALEEEIASLANKK